MGDRPILPITIDTMLNNNGLNLGDGLNFITCEQTFINEDTILNQNYIE